MSAAAALPPPSNTTASVAPTTPAAQRGFFLFGKDGLTFDDLIDALNPLQHVPLLSIAYRQLSGDQIDPLPKLAGGALFGGIAGLVSAGIDVLVEAVSGQDIGEHAVSLVRSAVGLDPASPRPADDVAVPAAATAHGASPGTIPPLANRMALASVRAKPANATAPALGPDVSSLLVRARGLNLRDSTRPAGVTVVNAQLARYERGAQLARGRSTTAVDVFG